MSRYAIAALNVGGGFLYLLTFFDFFASGKATHAAFCALLVFVHGASAYLIQKDASK